MLLRLDNLEKHFGGLPAVHGVTFAVDDGEILAVVGPNGAGKSTLLKMIAGIEAPTAGAISFNGREVSGLSAHRIRQLGIATVLQTPRTFPSMTTRENAALGAMFGGAEGRLGEREALERADDALEMVGLAPKSRVEAGNLTLHDQRFLGLARSIASRPRLLLLDEVMAGLNDTELHDAVEIVRRVRDLLGVTVVWVEHVMKAVTDLAERIVVLNFGTLLAAGEPAEVLRHPEVVRAYLGESDDAA